MDCNLIILNPVHTFISYSLRSLFNIILFPNVLFPRGFPIKLNNEELLTPCSMPRCQLSMSIYSTHLLGSGTGKANTHILIINKTKHFLQWTKAVLNAILLARGRVPQPVADAVLLFVPCEYICRWPMRNPYTKQQPGCLTKVHQETAE